MNEITLAWLANLVFATNRRNRPHSANLDAIGSFFDREMTSLNWTFGAISALAVTLSAAMLGALFSLLDSSVTKTVASKENNVTTTNFIEESGGFGASELALSILLAALAASVIGSLIFNRFRHLRLRRTYASTVELYYMMHRITR